MKRILLGIALTALSSALLTACGGTTSTPTALPNTGVPTAVQTQATTGTGAATMTSSGAGQSTPSGVPGAQPSSAASTPPSSGSYPKFGHAPDYSWIAGRVVVTKIQSGCTFVATEDTSASGTQAPAAQATGPVVGTAVAGDTSPPLRDITPVVGTSAPSGPIGPMFSPNGNGWNSANTADGTYVVLFGHLAGPGDAIEMCPGGTPYIVDSMQANP